MESNDDLVQLHIKITRGNMKALLDAMQDEGCLSKSMMIRKILTEYLKKRAK